MVLPSSGDIDVQNVSFTFSTFEIRVSFSNIPNIMQLKASDIATYHIILPTNSSISIVPSPSTSPRSKIASIYKKLSFIVCFILFYITLTLCNSMCLKKILDVKIKLGFHLLRCKFISCQHFSLGQ